MRSFEPSHPFAERFTEPEVNCFHRAIANGCDRSVPGVGLLLLHALSLDRARGLDPVPMSHQSGLDRAFAVAAQAGVSFDLRQYSEIAELRSNLVRELAGGSSLICPAGSLHLYFLERREKSVAHYPHVDRLARDGQSIVVRESGTGMPVREPGLVEIVVGLSALERAICGYDGTLGASMDAWGTYWTLAIKCRAEERNIPSVLRLLLGRAIASIADNKSIGSVGFDAARIELFEQTIQRDGAISDAMCKAYLRDANFASVHMRATVIALEWLYPALSAPVRSATRSFIAAAAQARSKYIIKTMITRSAAADDLMQRLMEFWLVYRREVEPALHGALMDGCGTTRL